MRESIDNFVQPSLRTIGRESNSVEVNAHLDFWGIHEVVSWITYGEHSKVDQLGQRGVILVESTDVVTYSWINAEVVGTRLS